MPPPLRDGCFCVVFGPWQPYGVLGPGPGVVFGPWQPYGVLGPGPGVVFGPWQPYGVLGSGPGDPVTASPCA